MSSAAKNDLSKNGRSMKSVAVRLLTCTLLILISVFFNACARYFRKHTDPYPVPAGSGIGVIVYPSSDNALLLESILNSMLIERGFRAGSFRRESILPVPLARSVDSSSTYSMELPEVEEGEIEVEADADVLAEFTGERKYENDRKRLLQFVSLLDSVADVYGIHYVLSVHQTDTYSFVVNLADVKRRQIVFTYAVVANRYGWEKIHSRRTADVRMESGGNDSKQPIMVYTQLALYLIQMLRLDAAERKPVDK